MILQSENPIRMVCELKGAKLSILMLLGLVKQPVSQEWLERNSGYTDKPVSQALQYLQEHGLAAHNSRGWIACKDGQQLVLGVEIEEESEKEQIASSDENKEHPSRNDISESRNNSDSVNYLSKLVVVEDININNPTTTDLNLTPKDGKIPTSEEIQKILDAAEELFGNRIMGEPRDYTDIDRLLSWIAKAYDGFQKSSKSKVYNPAGLVFWAFHKGKEVQIEKRYLDFDRVELPESFCRESGQWDFEDGEE